MADPLPPPPTLLDGAALFLDFDGTLVELAETPDAIAVPAGARRRCCERLRRRLDGRLAIVSGRSIADLERHLPCTGIAVSGSHGLELRLADGTRLPLSVPAGTRRRARRGRALRRRRRGGLIVEDKPAGIALHYRLAPDAEDARRAPSWPRSRRGTACRSSAARWSSSCGRAAPTKGDALKAFMTEPKFTGARPLFVGDDLTDEHGFAAAAELGGAGILVGPAARDRGALPAASVTRGARTGSEAAA